MANAKTRVRIETSKKLVFLKSQYGENSRDNKHGFNGTTYLWMRANDTDNGVRPVPSGEPAWMSPDLNVFPLTGVGDVIEETTIRAGTRYSIECTVRNMGDLDLPFVTVDFFLVTPSLGFRTSAAETIGLTSTDIPGAGAKKVTYEWTASPSHAGHKCLFARAYSLSPMDVMDDFDALNSRVDRHISQQNLNIVYAGDTVEFNVFPFGGKNGGDFHFEFQLLKVIPTNIQASLLKKRIKVINSRAVPDFRVEVDKQKMAPRSRIAVRKIPRKQGWNVQLAGTKVAKMKYTVPRMRLRKGQAKLFQLVKTDKKNNEVTGGIVILVVGK
jgi:hypothetical protein